MRRDKELKGPGLVTAIEMYPDKVPGNAFASLVRINVAALDRAAEGFNTLNQTITPEAAKESITTHEARAQRFLDNL